MTLSDNPPIYTRSFWAKAQPYRQRGPERIHLLEHHLADVGACFEALLAQPTIRQRLARSGGIDDLDEATAARLCVFAALHDIGKVNVGFQTQVWRDQDFPVGSKPTRSGHDSALVPVLDSEKDWETAQWFFDALGWWWDATESWDDRSGETVCALFVATLSHHGTPIQLDSSIQGNPRIWRRLGQLEPRPAVERIGRLARLWFPAAFSAGARRLPCAPAFQHMFLGLCTLADWIGSNEAWFPYSDEPRDDYMDEARENARRAIDVVGLNLCEQRRLFQGAPDFGALFPHIGDTPNAIQKAAALEAPEEPLVIIESETGSGKTEAALWRFARMYEAGLVDGLYFALPTRAAASQLHERVNRFVKRLFPGGDSPEVVLAVPGYVKAGDITGNRLQDYVVWWEDHAEGAAAQRRWAAESSKRYLAAQIAVGTVDQAMMAALQVKHAHLRAACLARNLLVVDEVHASDPYMRVILEALLNAHLGAGGYALLMSATLGSTARRQWLAAGRPEARDNLPLGEAVRSPYPAVSTAAPAGERVEDVGENDRSKDVRIEAQPTMNDPAQVAERALGAARAGAKVLVIRNTVAYAVAAQQAIEAASSPGESRLLFSLNGVRTLHTGRFAAEDRKLLDDEVEAQIGKERAAAGRIVVGTQTLEQSLDIDADLLITDLCPVDVLLQRIGRLHRHRRDNRPDGYRTPACVVLTPEGDDLSPLLTGVANANGLGPHGYVYADLRVLEATRRLIGQHGEWSIPRMNRELVERATHPDTLEAIALDKGEEWQAHGTEMTGVQYADENVARFNIIKRTEPFFRAIDGKNGDVVFPGSDEEIRDAPG